MTEALHSFISTIIYTAFICAVMLTLTPSGRVKKAEEMLCGIVMILALVSIIKGIDIGAYAESIAGYKSKAEEYTQSGRDYTENLNRTIIEDECEAYILDKAKSLNVDIRSMRVTASWSNDGFWYPSEISIEAECTNEQKNKLIQWIEAEFGIESEMQTWT